MNYKELEKIIKHIQKNCTCLHCKEKYRLQDIHVIATTKLEGLFDIKCKKCNNSSIINVLITQDDPEKTTEKSSENYEIINTMHRDHKSISCNDILDMKNFLSHFDGNFKKIFTKKK